LIQPDKFLTVDEVGCNTSQKNDGNIGGELMLTAKGMAACKQAAFKDCHFTTLGLMAATGEAVCCCIIIAAKTMKASWVTGINPFSASDDLDLKTTVMAMTNDFLLAETVSSMEKLCPVLSAAVKAVQLHWPYWLTC